LIGLILHLLTLKPWIVDLRDSITEKDYPPDPVVRQTYLWIERQAVRRASLLIFTATSAMQMYLERYPFLRPDQCHVISNGYDSADFSDIRAEPTIAWHCQQRPVHLVHNGLIYPSERDPGPFFVAISRLKAEGKIDPTQLRVDLRASGSEASYQVILESFNIHDMVRLLPQISYRMALQEAMQADAMLLFQARNCDHQIPAKVYEYLALRKPILALTSETGDTAELLRETGGATIVDIADEAAICRCLIKFLQSVRAGIHPLPDQQRYTRYSRRSQTQVLGRLLDKILDSRSYCQGSN